MTYTAKATCLILSSFIFWTNLYAKELDGNSTGLYNVAPGSVPMKHRREGDARDWDKTLFPISGFFIRTIGLQVGGNEKYMKAAVEHIRRKKAEGLKIILRTTNRYSWHTKIEEGHLANVKKSLDSIFNYIKPEDLYGLCIGEENVAPPHFEKILNDLYDYIKEKWPSLKVFQWYSSPIIPGYQAAVLKADGWITDNYGLPNPAFRRMMMHFVVMGKTIVNVVDSSNGTGMASSKSKPAFKNNTLKIWKDDYWNGWYTQLFTSREFDIPVCFFNFDVMSYRHGVDGKDPFHEQLVYAMFLYDQWLKTLRPGAFPTADYSNAKDIIEIVGNEKGLFKYEDDFRYSQFINDAAIEGFMDFVWEPGKLKVRGYKGRNVHCSLIYELKSYFKLKNAKISISGAVDEKAEGKIILSASKDGKNYVKTGEIKPGETDCSISFTNEDKLEDKLWVRLDFRGKSGSIEDPVATLKSLNIESEHEIPSDKTIHLTPPPIICGWLRGYNTMVEYADDYKISERKNFHADTRLSESAEMEQVKRHYCGITVRNKEKGQAVLDMIYHFVSQYPLNYVKIELDGRFGAYGSDFSIAVSKDGKTWTNEVKAKDTLKLEPPFKSTDRRGVINLYLEDVKQYRDIKDFYVRLRAVSLSSKRGTVWLRNLRLSAKTEVPKKTEKPRK